MECTSYMLTTFNEQLQDIFTAKLVQQCGEVSAVFGAGVHFCICWCTAKNNTPW